MFGTTGGRLEVHSGFMYPLATIGERIVPRDTALTLDGTLCGGNVIYSGASATMTLPTILTDASSISTSTVGLWFDFINVGAGNPDRGHQWDSVVYKVAAKTSVTVAPQQSMRVTAAKDLGGTFFWVAKASAALAWTPALGRLTTSSSQRFATPSRR